MRLVFALTLLIAGSLMTALAHAQPFRAGISRITVGADMPFDILVWYPTQAEEVPWQEGPFAIPASRDAAIAPGRFPVVLLSHGGGAGGESPLVLRELMVYLARQGFLIVAPFHGNVAHSLITRPRQIARSLDAVLAEPRFNEHVDPTRLGMLGFSLGGAVTLVLAGGTPSEAHLAAYCGMHPDDTMACGPGPGSGTASAASTRDPSASAAPLTAPLPLKAIVLLDPGPIAPFDHNGLATVDMPVLLYRPEKSALRADGNALALAAALPLPPREETIPGGHFIFVDVCPPLLESSSPDVCKDPQGVDRAAVHARIEAEIANFFHDNL